MRTNSRSSRSSSILHSTLHTLPLQALPEDIEKYRDRYLSGWDRVRRTRHARQTESGIINTSLSPLDQDIGPPYDFPDAIAQLGPGEITRPVPWQQLTTVQRDFQAEKMAIHAAMIDRMDRENRTRIGPASRNGCLRQHGRPFPFR